MTDILCCIAISVGIVCAVLIVAFRNKKDSGIDDLRRENAELKGLISSVQQQSKLSSDTLRETVTQMLMGSDKRFGDFTRTNEESLNRMRNAIDEKLREIREMNEKKLNEMRETVDEKLQKTLNERISESFKQVSENLAAVTKGLGEMQALANGVGDLKKVLSNVKTRGIFGEIQLKSILEEIMAPEQYAENVATVPGSSNRVEFVVKLPGTGDKPVLLPIDAKFPGDTYSSLADARESGEAANIALAEKALRDRVKGEAKDIRDKYIHVPETTEFAIMFLPTEGLYAEVIRLGLVEELQRVYKVNIAGPTTMAALLNSLRMGFQTLAIQKRSAEVWAVLSRVKTEFEKFEKVIESSQKHMKQAQDDLEDLIGVRTRAINRQLRDIQVVTDGSNNGDNLLT